jgi:hypothetical protein
VGRYASDALPYVFRTVASRNACAFSQTPFLRNAASGTSPVETLRVPYASDTVPVEDALASSPAPVFAPLVLKLRSRGTSHFQTVANRNPGMPQRRSGVKGLWPSPTPAVPAVASPKSVNAYAHSRCSNSGRSVHRQSKMLAPSGARAPVRWTVALRIFSSSCSKPDGFSCSVPAERRTLRPVEPPYNQRRADIPARRTSIRTSIAADHLIYFWAATLSRVLRGPIPSTVTAMSAPAISPTT